MRNPSSTTRSTQGLKIRPSKPADDAEGRPPERRTHPLDVRSRELVTGKKPGQASSPKQAAEEEVEEEDADDGPNPHDEQTETQHDHP